MRSVLWSLLLALTLVSMACAAGQWYEPPGGLASTVSDSDKLLVQQGNVSRVITRGKLLEGIARGVITDNSTAFTAYTSLHNRAFAAYTTGRSGGFASYSGASIAKIFNPRDKKYGAKGDGSNNDQPAIQAAVNDALAQHGTVYLPNGTYRLLSTITASNGVIAASIRGESARGVVLAPTMTGTTPTIQDKRSSMTTISKATFENFTIRPTVNFTGSGIEVSGTINDIFRNIYIDHANYGIWLHDDSGPGTWTELNVFEDVWIDYANNAIRIEKGTGNGSFHGNDFNRVSINLTGGQIGVNHLSGYYYNARINLAMWATADGATIVNAQSNAENNVGSITLEMIAPNPPGTPITSRITGTSNGRFWLTGPFNYQGGTVLDGAGLNTDGSSIFATSNYKYTTTMTDTHLTGFTPSIATFNPHGTYNGRENMGLFKLDGSGNTSFYLNGFGGGWLFTGNTTYGSPLENSALGLGINLDGSALTTYNPAGMGLLTGPNEYAAYLKAGQFYIGSPDRKLKLVPGLGDPNSNIVADPGSVVMANNSGDGSMYIKESGTGNTGWAKVLTAGAAGTGNASTLNGFTASQTPGAAQIPATDSTGALVLPGNLASNGTKQTFGQTIIFSKSYAVTGNQDVLLGYNDNWSGTWTVSYRGTNRFSVKSFTMSLSDNHGPTSADYLKLRSYAPNTAAFGTPYVRFLAPSNLTPHLYLPITNAVSDGVLTVTFVSDIGHHPWFMPSAPAGTLGTSYPLTGL